MTIRPKVQKLIDTKNYEQICGRLSCYYPNDNKETKNALHQVLLDSENEKYLFLTIIWCHLRMRPELLRKYIARLLEINCNPYYLGRVAFHVANRLTDDEKKCFQDIFIRYNDFEGARILLEEINHKRLDTARLYIICERTSERIKQL